MKKIISLAVTAAFLCANPGFTQMSRIGVAGGVAGKVLAYAPKPGAAGRIMSSGKTVYHRDKISTDARSRMQVLLLDETVFTIGPNSEMELDEFVYDPFTNTGKISASVTKGVFRFVTGKIARKNPSDMKVKLPTGTIGIRGTIAGGDVSGFPILVALVGPGSNNNADERPGMITITSGGATVNITRPGFGVLIPGPGRPPTAAFKLTPKQMAQLSTKPKAQPGGTADAGPGGDTSATEESGEDSAGAKGDLSETESTGQLTQSFDEAGEDASQTSSGLQDGPSTWDELRASSLAPQSGYYYFSGSYSCTSPGGCSGAGTNSFSASVGVCFDTKKMDYLNIRLWGEIGDSGGTIEDTWSGSIPFGTGGGTAEYTFGTAEIGDFDGTKVTFKNADGVAGQKAKIDVAYSNTGEGTIVSGSAVDVGKFTP